MDPFRIWQMGKATRLKDEFLATCYHEAGHLVSAFEHDSPAITHVIIKKPNKIGVIDGTAGIDPAKVHPGRVTAIGLAGCMAEARADLTEPKVDVEAYQPGAKFNRNFDETLRTLYASACQVDPDQPDMSRSFLISYLFTGNEPVRGWGRISEGDLLLLRRDDLEDESELSEILSRAATFLEGPLNWKRIRVLSKKLYENPGKKFSRDEVISIIQDA